MGHFNKSLSNADSCATTNLVLGWKRFVDVPVQNGTRPWSLHQNSFLSQPAFRCASTEQLLTSLRNGTRVWNNATEGSGPFPERFQSSFIPLTCSFKWFSPREVCAILNRFSRIIMVGDSLTRHIVLGMNILLHGNFEYGGACLYQNKASDYFDNCRCDGMFSEAINCRCSAVTFDDNRKIGVCNGRQHFSLVFNDRKAYNYEDLFCTDGDTRPVFFYLSGGAHFHEDVNRTIQEFVEPNLKAIAAASFKCSTVKTLVSWGTMGAQARTLDKRFPKQARENTLLFNEATVEYILHRNSDIVIFDWWQLTCGGMTSDGLHLLTDVNVIKALYIVNYLDLISQAQ